MHPYRVVIGLEVHVQLATRTKLFCACPVGFGQAPNSATCPVCTGLPGAMPVMNRRAFDLALRAAVALGCDVAPYTKWDRKNYYYPDLPKNYQISQYELPLGENGGLDIVTASGPKRVGLIRIHLEEDAGKMMHDESGGRGDSLVDLNRTGTPLLEIVSKPELSSPEEARSYLEEMRLLVRQIGVGDGEMQLGNLRCDANVNLHFPQADGSVAATPIVEIKNLNSFRFLEQALRYEIARQADEFGRDPTYTIDRRPKTTAGWDEVTGRTVPQRTKESAADYRYFPEPDLVPVKVDEAWLARVRAEAGETPARARGRLTALGLKPEDADVLVRWGAATLAYFDAAVAACGDAKEVCNWLNNRVQATLNETRGDIATFVVTPDKLGRLIASRKQYGYSSQSAADVYEKLLDGADGVDAIVSSMGLAVAADEDAVRDIVRRAIAANARAVADFRSGKTAAANAIKGAAMRELKAAKIAASPEVVERVMREELAGG